MATGLSVVRRRYVIVGVVIASLLMIKGGYMQAKAHFAQYLIEQAWQRTLVDNLAHKPWSWADTFPVAKLSFVHQSAAQQGGDLFVLAGASGRNLAFGPAAILGNSEVNRWGNTIIAGHRDTHFARLKGVTVGQLIKLQDSGGAERLYRVSNTHIVEEHDTQLLFAADGLQLTLITCYPFEELSERSKLRFVVIALPIDSASLPAESLVKLDRHDSISA
ncbi:class GN sortase [Shewanella colwelliana]|nr:class GN sortase [Shewanella colwelliana]MDX1282082.1 class GN sortase [Shewanella colwelliana]